MHAELLYLLILHFRINTGKYSRVPVIVGVDSKLDLYQLSENVCLAYTSQQLLCSVHSSAAQPASP